MGTQLGALLTRALWPRSDWVAFGAIATALGAVATFAVVLVALLPILQTRRRERDQALSLRLRVLTQLMILRRPVELRTHPGHREAPETFARDTDVPTEVLSALLRELVLLDAEESFLVHTVHLDLVAQRAVGGLSPEGARDSLALIDQAIVALDARLVLRGRVPLPWEPQNPPASGDRTP